MPGDVQTSALKNRTARADWFVAFNAINAPTNPTWEDGKLAVYGSRVHEAGDYVLVGDVWLSNKIALCNEYGIDCGETDAADERVLVLLWAKEREKILDKLQGAFAFIVYERRKHELQIVRDPIGARNIYLAHENKSFWVSPRLKTAAHCVTKEIDRRAMRDFLCCAFVPGEQTLFKHVREIRPGQIITLPQRKKETYWSLSEDYLALENESLEWHAERLRSLLEEVVSEQLPQDADAGCYLSGGIDSSCIAALARKLHSRDLYCYSIHFGKDCPNELEFSGMVANHIKAKHQIIEISSEQMWNLHEEAISILDDPIGDPLTVPNLILAQNARTLTPVILNGEGGDPCFGGPKNQPMMLDGLYRQGPASKSELEASYLASFQKCHGDLSRLLLPQVWNSLRDLPSVFAEDLSSQGHYVNKLLLINTKYKGADQILSKVNNICSSTGVEGRSPLFDKRVVSASLTIPPQYKLKGAQEKAVLKAAVQDLLPETILTRPKSGMMVPVQFWFRQAWQKRARALLLAKDSRIRDYLQTELISNWLDYKDDIWSRYGVKLWLLCSLELWLRVNTR